MIVTFDQIYMSALISSITDLLAYGFSGLVFKMLGVRWSFIVCFGISTVGGLFLLFWGLENQETLLFLILVLISKSGIACTFNIVYIAHTSVFPTLFATTSIGFCNFLAKTFTASSPLFA